MASRTRGVTFYIGEVSEDNTNKYHSYRDWGLHLASVQNPNPEPKYNIISVPGSSDMLDLTDVFGDTTYNLRTLIFTFQVKSGSSGRYVKNGLIANLLHGRSLKIILDDDSEYFYQGRVNFTEWVYTEGSPLGTLTFSCTCDPYKYDIEKVGAPWKWDTFSFVNGVIRDTTNWTVNGKLETRIIGTNKVIHPTVTASASMKISINDGEFVTVPTGTSILYELEIPRGEVYNKLVIIGNGNISISFRGVSF